MALQPQIAAAREHGEQVLYFTFYGDSMYPMLTFITRSHNPPLCRELDDQEEAQNFAKRHIRTSVE